MADLVAIALISYRRFLSPILHQIALVPGGCRFVPSCSEYGAAALRQYGLARGSVLIFRRLGRCHPWSVGGFDPIPRDLFSPTNPARRPL